MADQQQIDHYDFINAPQFVDFDDLHAQDDPDADKFFETHREEDDFFIPLDINNISPTVQLLYDEAQYAQEATKAAHDAGLDDVKIEYYASPKQSALSQPQQPSSGQKSISSVYGTPLGGSVLLSSGGTSFFTPEAGEDKENETPPRSAKNSSVKKILTKSSEENGSEEEKGLRAILAERSISAAKGTTSLNNSYASPLLMKKIKGQVDSTQSLYAQLDKLQIDSSSDDEDMENVKPTASELQNEESYSTFSKEKLSFLDLSGPQPEEPEQDAKSTSSSELDNTVVGQGQDSPTLPLEDDIAPKPEVDNMDKSISHSDEEDVSTGMELRTPIRNILQKLDAELRLEEENANSDDPRCSIVVAPSVGQQVHWNNLEDEISEQEYVAPPQEELSLCSKEESFNESRDDFEISLSSLTYKNRASSVGDLPYSLEVKAKERSFNTYGYNPRFGITIPKTPDVNACDASSSPQASLVGSETRDDSHASARNQASDKNSCYFEIDAPPKRNLRRVSSCGDLQKFQQQKAVAGPSRVPRIQPIQKKKLTVPRTPETVKRAQKGLVSKSNMSSASSVGSNGGPSLRGRAQANRAGPTVAERLNAARERRQPFKANHYVSMAEAMINYQKNTPDRFRTLPKGRVPEKRSTSCDARKRTGPTPPRSPEFATASRSRAVSSYEHKESDDLVQFSSAASCLPKKLESRTTVPKPFNFSSSHRPRNTAPVEVEVVDYKFKARPAPSKLRSDTVTAVKPKLTVKVTQPMPPHFASDDRLKERQLKKAQSATTSPKAKQGKQPAPKTSRIPTTAQRPISHFEEHKTTTAQPFSSAFEARQRDILLRKEKKKQELEQEAKIDREFHANPAPKFFAKPPKKKSIDVTHVEPFRLKSDERGAAYQEAFKRKLEEEEEKLREQAKFHAQPADVLTKPPFEPEKSSKLLESPLNICLATEKRAVEREQFDEQIRLKEKEEEERRREEQEKLEELQRLEDIERRRQMVHKAQPFKEPKPFQLKASGKPLTVPQSPAFSALPSERRIKGQTPPRKS